MDSAETFALLDSVSWRLLVYEFAVLHFNPETKTLGLKLCSFEFWEPAVQIRSPSQFLAHGQVAVVQLET